MPPDFLTRDCAKKKKKRIFCGKNDSEKKHKKTS